jgi:hypothetical protein
MTRDKLLNLEVFYYLKKRDCHVASLLAMTTLETFYEANNLYSIKNFHSPPGLRINILIYNGYLNYYFLLFFKIKLDNLGNGAIIQLINI